MEGRASRRGRSRLHRTLIGVAAAIVAIPLTTAATTAPAAADASGFGYTDGESVGAGAEETPRRSSRRGGRSSCEWDRLSPEDEVLARRLGDPAWEDPATAGAGNFYHRICERSGQVDVRLFFVPNRASAQVLAERALDEAPIPLPAPQMNPPAEQGAVVNVELWLWLDPEQWRPVSATAEAGGVQVTTTASPQSVEWDMGNGDVVVCPDPGTAYDPGRSPGDQATDCAYTYRRSSAHTPGGHFTVTATVTWGIAWSVTGAGGGGQLAPATRSTSVDVAVAEIQTLNR